MDMMKRLFRIFMLVTLLILVDVSTAQGDSLPESAYISGVNGHAQKHSLSCEARSAADLATFWGIRFGENEFLQALPRADNPEKGFVGDPDDTWGYLPPQGYGVHADPVADTLRGYGLEAEALNNLSWDDLRAEINAGHPVIVWVIGQMWGGMTVDYEAPDGSTARVAAFEHTMILTGYNQDTVQVVDAYSGLYQTYRLSTFLNSWAVLGNMAVFGSREVSNQVEPAPEAHSESYTVQPGDYLVALAKRFGTTWQELAQLNSIGYPFTIHPGQELRLPGGLEDGAELVPEPVPVEPPPTNKVVNFQACLPLVQRDYAAQFTPTFMGDPVSPEPIQPVNTLSSNIPENFGVTMGVDWQLLDRLKDLIHPYLIHTGKLLRMK
jgi:uncharacterized protein YvpB